ncbi:MAG: hypothetical protein ABIP85_15515 [Chthoniobacteraceae bacterium]
MKSASLIMLFCAVAFAAENPWSEGDPGVDLTVFPSRFHPLKSRLALQYHLNRDDGAPMEDRIALANAFNGLKEYEQRTVLCDQLWPRARCDAFRPVLEAMLHMPEKAEQEYGDPTVDLVLGRLIELGSNAARKFLLEDIRSGYPRLAIKGLAALPERDMPELDAAFRRHLIDDKCDFWKISFAIGRYGSPALLEVVKSYYEPHAGHWACALQSAMLRYLIKHDPDYGLAKLEQELSSRGQSGKNNCFGDAIYDAVEGLKDPKITAFAIKQLSADHQRIRYSAVKYLIESNDREARNAVISMVLPLPPRTMRHNGQYYPDLREQVLSILLRYPAWKQAHLPSLIDIDRLERNLSSVEKEYYKDEIIRLRGVLRE